MKRKKKRSLKPKREKKISFLSKRKDVNDKFFSLVDKYTKKVPINVKKSKRYPDGVKWIRKGVGKLAAELEISQSRLKRSIDRGFINEKDDYIVIDVERVFEESGLKKTHQVTREYTIHNFTKDNFFPKKNIKSTRGYQFYFRCGLWMQFRSGKKGFYTIQNLPISHYSTSYNRGYNEFFEIIQLRLESYPSLIKFRFNYFDVEKIKI